MKKLIFLLFVLLSFRGRAQNDPGPMVGDTGTITFNYQGAAVTYTTVRAADGLIWLQQNLGAPQVANYATDTAAYGHYFQWGRWDDGHQLPNSLTAPVSSINPANPAGLIIENDNFLLDLWPANWWWYGGTGNDTWTDAPPSTINGTDPCAAVGPGWHMPTQPEYANVFVLEAITDTASAYNSSLKITLSGRRDLATGYIGFSDTSASFWTATVSDTLASAVVISSYNGVTINWPSYRGYGASVRCVATCTGVNMPGSIIGPDTACSGDIHTWMVGLVNYASQYLWSVPTGWSIIGSSNGNAITVLPGTGSGTITVRSANACDTSAVVVKNVTGIPLPQPQISQSGSQLSTGSFSSYQWLINDTIIPGATSNSYTAAADGPYKVIVTDAYGCSDTSAAYIFSLGVNSLNIADNITVYPNPATNGVNITAPYEVEVTIYSMDGKVVLKQVQAKKLDLGSLSAGVYQVEIRQPGGGVLKREKLLILPQ